MELIKANKAIFLVLFVLGFSFLKMAYNLFQKNTGFEQDAGYSYEMIRPQSYTSSFSLSDREIDRTIFEDEEEKLASLNAKEAQNKKGEAQKNNKSVDTKRLTKKSSDKDKKKGNLALETVDTSLKTGLSKDSEQNLSRLATSDTEIFFQSTEDKTKSQNDSDKSPKEDDKKKSKTIAEWKRILTSLSGSHLAKSIEEFNQAHVDHEVKDAEFYALAIELFKDANNTNSMTGESILKDDSTNNGFVYLASEYQNIGSALQGKLWSLILTYSQSSKIAGLVLGLSSKDKIVVNLTLQVLNVAVQNQKLAISTAQTSENSNRGIAGIIPSSSFRVFLGPLNSIVKENDEKNTNLASGLLADIQKFLEAA